MTFSAEQAAAVLKRRGKNVLSYQWDFTGDGNFDEETIVPTVSVYYDRQGAYNLKVVLNLSDKTTRTVSYRVAIPNAVFSYNPVVPTVDEPIKFSVAHLVAQDTDVKVREVTWDFDNDGIPEEKTTELETTHTFLRTGSHTVTVTIVYSNQSQNYFFRTLNINEPAPLPFPVSISTTPDFLESPAPFQVVFRIETEEPLTDVKWDFDDGSPEEVGDRVGHTFRDRRVFQVTASARNKSGEISKVTKVVRVVDELRIADLKFDGTHAVESNKISAEAPVAIELTPKTILPLVDFWWEAPGASQVNSTDTTLKAIFRDEGLYTLVMLAKDAEGRVKRLPIELSVNPKSQNVTFDMKPTQGVAPLNVQFDASDSFIPGDPINGFIWEFDAGAQGTQVEQRFGGARVENEYIRPGEYTVRLTVSTESGRTESTSKKIVVRAPFLKACFTSSRTEGPAPLGVRFDRSCSTGSASKVTWDFGDGAQSPLKDDVVVHTFGETGSSAKEYKVKLLLEDINGTVDTVEQVIRTY
jgi:PKD repeat protein